MNLVSLSAGGRAAPASAHWRPGAAWRDFTQRTFGRLTLADGRQVRVRPIHPSDAAAEQAFLATLSARSRLLRFHGAMKQLPPAVLQAMTALDFDDHVALVAEAAGDDGAARLVADARYVREGAGQAEFAVAVADDWQGLGLGRELLQRLGNHARSRGLGHLRGSVLSDNEPMLALMRSLGAHLRLDPDDASIVQASLVF